MGVMVRGKDRGQKAGWGLGRIGAGAGTGVRIKVRKVSNFRMEVKDSIKMKTHVV